MNLMLLVICSLALCLPLTHADGQSKNHDPNFRVAYGLSSVLQRAGFSKVLDESFNITGRPTYIRSFAPIDHQLILMLHESFLRLPPNIIVKIVGELRHVMNSSLPMLEKHHPEIARALLKGLQSDIKNFCYRLKHRITFISHYLHKGNATEAEKKVLSKFNRHAQHVYGIARNMFKTHNLREANAIMWKIFKYLPKLDYYQRNFCKIVLNHSSQIPLVSDAIIFSKEFFPLHLRRSISFMQNMMIRHMVKYFLKSPPVQRIIDHFEAVVSKNVTKEVKQFYRRYGIEMLKEKLRLMLAIVFRPKGTFTKLKDFARYLRYTIRAFKSIPENLKSFLLSDEASEFLNKTSVPQLIKQMKQPNAIKNGCLAMVNHLPQNLLQKLKARPGFESDIQVYCQSVEGHSQVILQLPNHLMSLVNYAKTKFAILESDCAVLNATFASESVHFVGIDAHNPGDDYKQVRPNSARSLMLKNIDGHKQEMFLGVRIGVKVISEAMYGYDACSHDHHHRQDNSTNHH